MKHANPGVGEGMDLEVLFLATMMLAMLFFAAAWGVELDRKQEQKRRAERLEKRAIRRASND